MDTNNPDLMKGHFFVRETGGSLIPYVKMSLRNNLSFKITEIITAPLAISDTVASGLDFALYNAGYKTGDGNVVIKQSGIRLRRL